MDQVGLNSRLFLCSSTGDRVKEIRNQKPIGKTGQGEKTKVSAEFVAYSIDEVDSNESVLPYLL